MASNMNATKVSCPGTSTKPPHQVGLQCRSANFEPLDKSSSSTLKRNPKMELTKPDLTKLLAYMEGELQAKDVVIATLKSERVKQLLNGDRYHMAAGLSDPYAALERDSFASAQSQCDEAEIQVIANHQMGTLDNLVLQQRRAQLRMCRILKDSEERHRKVIQELEEEKKKHEHDTAQGDDITYGLERERTRLKQELELEKQGKKKLEKEIKKMSDVLEEERSRQKQIVIMLLQDRKKFANKYLEERKRSEDLAQILTEEKSRIDLMAEGLEEESKKSLQMEAELEKQLAQFDIERQQNRALHIKEEKRYKELQAEAEKSREEVEAVRKQLAEAQGARGGIVPARPPQPPCKPALAPPAAGAMMSSVAKVVQPTATVSSVPVCGPTTGIARSVSPGQGLRPEPPAQQPPPPQPKLVASVPRPGVGAVAAPGAKAALAGAQGGKLNFHAGADASKTSRGAPPPVPPNKPVVPPKKEAAIRNRTLSKAAAAEPPAAVASGGGGGLEEEGLPQVPPT